tara:strand:- start:12424 stop:12765 length:342 start_codon:yes stop_codon:yes gene_type:complete
MADIKSDLLTEAQALVTGPRAKDYGDAAVNHMRIADLWNCWLRNRSWGSSGIITPYDAAMMMVFVKAARCQQQPSHDSHVDIAGYAAVLEDIYEQIKGVQEDGRQKEQAETTD